MTGLLVDELRLAEEEVCQVMFRPRNKPSAAKRHVSRRVSYSERVFGGLAVQAASDTDSLAPIRENASKQYESGLPSSGPER